MPSKWSGPFWADLFERVGSVAVYGLITALTTVNVSDLDWDQAWAIIVLPTVLSFLKGLLANMKDPDSGASLLSAPPGPVLEDAAGHDVANKSFESSHKKPDQTGAGEGRFILLVALGVLVALILWWVITAVVHDDNDKNDGGRGLDWERAPHSQVRL